MLIASQVSRAQGIRLSNNRDQIDPGAQSLHDLDIQRLEGVASGSDKVQAGVDTEIDLVGTARLLLLEHVRLMLVVQEFDDGHPRVAVVDIVAEARGINNSQTNWEIVSRPPVRNIMYVHAYL